jgi:RNA polymerase sigma factor (sigma-70 family)
MDRYAYVIEWLRRDDFARLRGYAPDANCKFTTWLVVVARRLCLDYRRRRYGEADWADEAAMERHAARRRLSDLVGEQIDLADLSGPSTDSPDWEVRSTELRSGLENALRDLGPQERLLLKLRFEFDLPAREIAELMNFPTPFHVYRRVNHLLSLLKSNLVREGIKDPIP